MVKPLISICVTSIRNDDWRILYDSFNAKHKDVSSEMIVVSPLEATDDIPFNVKYVKTENIKPAQCLEISVRESQGDFIMTVADDCIIENSLDDFYLEYNEALEREGHSKLLVLPRFKYGGKAHKAPYNRKAGDCPTTSTLGALIPRSVIEELGGFDRRFLGVYWDIDFCMRYYQIGGKILYSRSRDIIVREDPSKNDRSRLCRKLRRPDRETVDSFWVRDIEDDEDVPSDTCYCHYTTGGDGRVLSKYRIKEFESYENDNIKLFSQGTDSHGDYGWV